MKVFISSLFSGMEAERAAVKRFTSCGPAASGTVLSNWVGSRQKGYSQSADLNR